MVSKMIKVLVRVGEVWCCKVKIIIVIVVKFVLI